MADVLSHLGSGSELWLVRLRAGIEGVDIGGIDNHAVWDRWNAMSPEDQAEEFVKAQGAFVETLESLDADQRERVNVDLGFLPAPAPLSQAVGMRLVEVANHAWDASRRRRRLLRVRRLRATHRRRGQRDGGDADDATASFDGPVASVVLTPS